MSVKLSVCRIKEDAIEEELVRKVHELGGRCEKVQVIGRRGFFDRLVILPGGKIIFVEVKRPRGGKFAEHQRRYAEEYKALGAAVALIRSWEDIHRLLNE